MKIRVIAVGRPKAGGLADAIAEYERRAARYWPLEVYEVRAEAGGGGIDESLRKEGERLLERAPGVLVACDERGAPLTSLAFAQWLQGERELARDVSFLIGSAWGLAPAVRERAGRVLSLAPWTLPHDLARLVLAEQLYRAGTIVRGEPYHK